MRCSQRLVSRRTLPFRNSHSHTEVISATITITKTRDAQGFKADLVEQEVKLSNNNRERDLHDSLAEIFSIIVTLDQLEKAFLKDAIPAAEYTEICDRSLKQYKSILSDEAVERAFVGLEEFKAQWGVRFLPSCFLRTGN